MSVSNLSCIFLSCIYIKRRNIAIALSFPGSYCKLHKSRIRFFAHPIFEPSSVQTSPFIEGNTKNPTKKVMIPRAKRIRNAVERTKVTHATPSFTTIDIDTLLTNAICCVVCFSIALTILICWTFYYIDIHGGWRRSNCWITQFMHFISGDSIIVCGVTLCALRITWHARGSAQDFFGS